MKSKLVHEVPQGTLFSRMVFTNAGIVEEIVEVGPSVARGKRFTTTLFRPGTKQKVTSITPVSDGVTFEDLAYKAVL